PSDRPDRHQLPRQLHGNSELSAYPNYSGCVTYVGWVGWELKMSRPSEALLDWWCWFDLVEVNDFKFQQSCTGCYRLTSGRDVRRLTLRAALLKIFLSLPFGNDEVAIFTLGRA